MNKYLLRGLVLVTGFCAVLAFGEPARAGYFINAFASSPLGTFLFGDFDHHTGAFADSVTSYTNGVSQLFAEGYASTSLSTGVLKSEANANLGYLGACPTVNCNTLSPFGNANFGDSLTFLGSFSSQVVTFHASIGGTWSGNCDTACVGPGAATVQFLVLPGGTIDQYSANPFALFDPSSPFYNPHNVGPSATLPLNFDIPFSLNGVNPTIDIAADLDISGLATVVGQTFDGNFRNTAVFSFTAPPGVTVLSASRVFPGTIPEPATLALLSIGLAGLGFSRRKQM